VQLPVLKQPPGVLCIEGNIADWLLALRSKPSQVGVRCNARKRRDAAKAASHPGSQQTLSGEQGHLGIIGDLPKPAIRWCVSSNSVGTKAAKDLGALYELHRRPERIADGAAEQATKESVPDYLRLVFAAN
jgi:hypothetical protein